MILLIMYAWTYVCMSLTRTECENSTQPEVAESEHNKSVIIIE